MVRARKRYVVPLALRFTKTRTWRIAPHMQILAQPPVALTQELLYSRVHAPMISGGRHISVGCVSCPEATFYTRDGVVHLQMYLRGAQFSFNWVPTVLRSAYEEPINFRDGRALIAQVVRRFNRALAIHKEAECTWLTEVPREAATQSAAANLTWEEEIIQ